MSFIYDPELVRLLTAERLAGAQEAARRNGTGRSTPGLGRVFGLISGYARRTTGLRSTPSACTCQ
jgi:hypothetical protein